MLFNKPEELRDYLGGKIGHKLMMLSKEVKKGTIRNQYALRYYTASMAYQSLKDTGNSDKKTK